jgi:hypothetical protein
MEPSPGLNSDHVAAGAPAARVTRLFIYPIKGAAGIEIDAAELDDFGFRHDRRWMVVSPAGMFLSQRAHPRMTLIRVTLREDALSLGAPDMTPCDVPIPDPTYQFPNAQRRVTVWRDTVDAISAGPEPALWLSRFLGIDCELVWMPPASRRPVGRAPFTGMGRTSFADAYPFLLVSAEAVTELAGRIPTPVITVHRFRPNIVVAGAGAHAEDGWRWIRVGTTRFFVAKPCARCAVTTVDPTTGVRGTEPLRTLAAYRAREGEVYFGQNLIHEATGRLRVNDVVEVLERAY